MAQQERQDAYTEDLPAISQPPEEPRSSSAPSAGAPALSTVESEARPETRGRSAVPSQDSSRPWRPVEDGPESIRSTADGQGDDHRAALPGELRDDQDDDLEHPGGGLLDERNVPETTPPRRTLRGPLGSMPRGPLAVALIGIVILAMILVPLAVDKFVTGRYGPDASPVAQQTVLDGNAPLNQLLTISGRLGSGSAPSIALANEASLSAPSSVLTDVVETGHGRVVSEGSPVILQVSQFSGLDGRNTTGNADGYKLWRNMLSPAAGDYINAAVSGQREGTRVVLRAPSEDSSTAEITIVDILPTTATGETKEPAPGTPAVTEGADGSITVSSAGLPVPTRAATAILIKGTGPQIGSQDKVIVRRTMVSWATGQALGESTFGYQNLPKRIDMSDALVGVSQNLVDITVGSRVVLSLPAEQAKGTEPVVVVIDVLAIDNDSESSAG